MLGWLEPLLSRIAEGKHHVVVPVIGNIDDDTFEYASFTPDNLAIGKFDWMLVFRWMVIPKSIEKTRKTRVAPIRLVNV